MSVFDECYETSPGLENKPNDFDQFWDNEIKGLKKIPFEETSKKKVSKKFLKEHNISVLFQSSEKYKIEAQLLAPKKMGKKPPVVVVFGDYLNPPALYKGLLNNGIGQFTIKMRGHDIPLKKTEGNDEEAPKVISYGYFAENLADKESYYLKHLLLDAYRAVEILRLRTEINTSRIGFFGEGIGALMALFVASKMKRAESLFLLYPDFMKTDMAVKATNHAQSEIRNYLKSHKSQRAKIEKNLTYFDGIFLADSIEIPSKTVVNIADNRVIPHGAFALFHQLGGEKDIHVYTDNSPNMVKKENQKNMKIMTDFFMQTLQIK